MCDTDRLVDATPTVIAAEEAAGQLPELLKRAASGEAFVIEDAGRPVANLTPADPTTPPPLHRKRVSPMLGDQIWIADDFDDPLPPEIHNP